jgi:hypothetical protein
MLAARGSSRCFSCDAWSASHSIYV